MSINGSDSIVDIVAGTSCVKPDALMQARDDIKNQVAREYRVHRQHSLGERSSSSFSADQYSARSQQERTALKKQMQFVIDVAAGLF